MFDVDVRGWPRTFDVFSSGQCSRERVNRGNVEIEVLSHIQPIQGKNTAFQPVQELKI